MVLVVDDDGEISDLVDEFLTDEGFTVTLLRDRQAAGVRAAIERLRPNCVLLDGDVPGNYGDSWGHAAWMSALRPPVPVIMFSADQGATREAVTHESERSQAAGFSSVILKPFELEDLLQAVVNATGRSPFHDSYGRATHGGVEMTFSKSVRWQRRRAGGRSASVPSKFWREQVTEDLR